MASAGTLPRGPGDQAASATGTPRLTRPEAPHGLPRIWLPHWLSPSSAWRRLPPPGLSSNLFFQDTSHSGRQPTPKPFTFPPSPLYRPYLQTQPHAETQAVGALSHESAGRTRQLRTWGHRAVLKPVSCCSLRPWHLLHGPVEPSGGSGSRYHSDTLLS